MPVSASAPRGQDLVPLAYVRTLVILPPVIRLPAPAPLPNRPALGEKRAVTRWNATKRQREQLAKSRSKLGERLSEALDASLGKLPGLSVDHPSPSALNRMKSANAVERLEGFLPECKADAALQPVIDGFIVRTGIQKEIWIRVSVVLGKTSPVGIRGTYSAVGRSAAAPSLFGLKGAKPEDELSGEAINLAARRLAHTLDTGEEQLFSRRSRICIIPAAVTGTIQYSAGDAPDMVAHSAEPVSRLADVLLQPEIGPFVTMIDPDEVDAALQTLKLEVNQFWQSETKPDFETIQTLCKLLRVSYVFVSRINDISIADNRITVMDVGMERAGIERRGEVTAEAALIRIADMKCIWQDTATGTTTSRTEYVRHNPRIVREGQCAADAARIAYAHLRYSLEEFQKRFDRRH